MKAITLFSSAGIDEAYLSAIGIDVIAANELLVKRAKIHEWLYPNCKMIIGDICNKNVFEKICNEIEKNKIEMLIATPPCQGMSIAGKNKNNKDMINDKRNHLIFKVIDLIEKYNFKYVLIENVARFLNVKYPYSIENSIDLYTIEEILNYKLSDKYEIYCKVFDCADYGIPQYRKRAIIRIYKKGLVWNDPKPSKHITVEMAIGYLPSLESGEISEIPYHYARKHNDKHINWMKHTSTGETALDNEKFYPTKRDGSRIRGFNTCYKRMRWDLPAPTVTIRSDAISSQNNVHPGRLLPDGTYSDARVLTIKELFILMSLPNDFQLPEWLSDTEIRQIIGEGVPPLLIKKILEGIKHD